MQNVRWSKFKKYFKIIRPENNKKKKLTYKYNIVNYERKVEIKTK